MFPRRGYGMNVETFLGKVSTWLRSLGSEGNEKVLSKRFHVPAVVRRQPKTFPRRPVRERRDTQQRRGNVL